jgi:hypothetical protein
VDAEVARQEWETGNRRLDATRRDPSRHALLLAQTELVIRELRRRVGQTFTLAELVAAYVEADAWVPRVLDDDDPETPVATEPGTVADAAFYAYARGAADYRP